MNKNNKLIFIVIAIFIALLSLTYFWSEKYYLGIGLILIIVSCVPFFIKFESKTVHAEEIVVIGLLVAIASVGRVPFASIPSVQPTSFIIIVSAMVFGGETGFMVGSLAAIVSNLFLGQGPWTPWQMFCWGMMGFTAGILKNTFVMKNKWCRLAFGFLWGFVFGWIMNMWFVLNFGYGVTLKAFAASCVSSFAFDLNHGLANVFFLSVFSTKFVNILNRIKIKYGLL